LILAVKKKQGKEILFLLNYVDNKKGKILRNFARID
jgi:hypothetical protein